MQKLPEISNISLNQRLDFEYFCLDKKISMTRQLTVSLMRPETNKNCSECCSNKNGTKDEVDSVMKLLYYFHDMKDF